MICALLHAGEANRILLPVLGPNSVLLLDDGPHLRQRKRAEFAARQRALRDRMADVFARWASAFDVEPALSHADVAAMTLFMADGFLLDRIIDPELDNGLYTTMCEVFLRGLVAMAEER